MFARRILTERFRNSSRLCEGFRYEVVEARVWEKWKPVVLRLAEFLWSPELHTLGLGSSPAALVGVKRVRFIISNPCDKSFQKKSDVLT